jgi:hypothetical protein
MTASKRFSFGDTADCLCYDPDEPVCEEEVAAEAVDAAAEMTPVGQVEANDLKRSLPHTGQSAKRMCIGGTKYDVGSDSE